MGSRFWTFDQRVGTERLGWEREESFYWSRTRPSDRFKESDKGRRTYCEILGGGGDGKRKRSAGSTREAQAHSL